MPSQAPFAATDVSQRGEAGVTLLVTDLARWPGKLGKLVTGQGQ